MGSTTSNVADITGLVKQLQSLKPSDIQDEETRNSLFEAARNVAFTLESTGDSIQRIAYIVRPHNQKPSSGLLADNYAPT